MNIKIISAIIAIFLMLISPALSTFVFNGNEDNNESEAEESIEVGVYITESGEIENIELEEYICGVLMGEINSDYNAEAIKANAVAVRSYVLRRVNLTEENNTDYHICDNPNHCMAYIDYDTSVSKWGEEIGGQAYNKIKNAVYATKGEVLCYNNQIADCVFHACSYKYTESAENVWGNAVPYLISVETPESNSPVLKEISISRFVDLTGDESITQDGIFDFSVAKSSNERVEKCTINKKEYSGIQIRNIFSLNSTAFDIKLEDDKIIFETYGKGHGVGLSQEGSNIFAEEGKSYTEILEHYYPETELKIY